MPLQTYAIPLTVAVAMYGNLRAPINPRTLSSEREANLLGAMLNLQPSAPGTEITGLRYDWGTETRRLWEVGDRLNVGEMLYQMGGIDAPGAWSKDADGQWQWTANLTPPVPQPVVVPRPPLVAGPGQVIVTMPGGLQVIREKSEVDSGTASSTVQDKILAAVLNISDRLKTVNI